MASRYFGINRGQTKKDIAEGASTNSTDIEVTVNEASIDTLSEIEYLLEEIRAYIQEDKRYR